MEANLQVSRFLFYTDAASFTATFIQSFIV